MEGKSVNFLQKQIEKLKREKEILLRIIAREADCRYCVMDGCLPCEASVEDFGDCEGCGLECRCKKCAYGSCFEWNGKGVEDAN